MSGTTKGARPIELEEADEGSRLDEVLARHLSLSRRQVRWLVADGYVRVNGRPVASGAKGRQVSGTDCIEVEPFEHPRNWRVLSAPAVLEEVAAGKGWIMVNKPAGMAVHPLRLDEQGTVLNVVIARYPQVHGVGEGGLRSGVVHRLDRDTSGVLLLALDQLTWSRLRAAFRARRVEKIYQAIVHGRLTGCGRQTMDLVIAQHRPARVRSVEVAAHRTRGAVRRCGLRWRALQNYPCATLVEVHLETGFLHQIRVMLAQCGHPLIGDRLYGWAEPSDQFGAGRTMLAAVSLRVGAISGRCDPAPDFRRLLGALNGLGPQACTANSES